jgi:hypothetical protein
VLLALLAVLGVGLGSCAAGYFGCLGPGCSNGCCSWVCVAFWCFWDCDYYCQEYYESLEADPLAPPPEEVW